MIAKVVRGYRPGGLIVYLFGPGRFEEHRNPRVVGSWDGLPWLHQPDPLPPIGRDGVVVEPGEFDLDLRQLIATMSGPARAAGLPVSHLPALPTEWAQLLRTGGRLPAEAPGWARLYRFDPRRDAVVLRPGYVWHCSVRLHPDDPTLTDDQWQRIAERLMRATGIHQAGCRWIAVRHADDHIHLVATLVCETTGKRFHPYRDYLQLRAECQRLERELELVRTAPADKTALPAPTRAELAKAQRLGRSQTTRQELRRLVGHRAATTSNPAQFLAALQDDGLHPHPVLDPTGHQHGYTVTLPGDYSAAGQPIRYSGSALATDLTWPKLLQRWASTPPPVPTTKPGRVPLAARQTTLRAATELVHRTRTALRDGTEDPDGAAHATGELLTALAGAHHGRATGQLTTIAQRYDRAARTPHHVLPSPLGPLAADLRHAARQLGAIGAMSGRGHERLATTALILAVTSLIVEIAAWQSDQRRPHQAIAAHETATGLATITSTSRPPVSKPARQQPGDLLSLQGERVEPHRPRPPSHGYGPTRGR